ncbi:hypothetical protein BN13_640002 [Nostocoides jenkinsii Ben 74]|uniref:Uncharacterized protein n=1 Tax=Nostocoides jenkinsii Ben 74 TaxID=1193518 RepID=A0A077MFX5_9MICO|nr:hypothetical protein BN13_640002 [Tetrasphaera jenkinsii Ben 74]
MPPPVNRHTGRSSTPLLVATCSEESFAESKDNVHRSAGPHGLVSASPAAALAPRTGRSFVVPSAKTTWMGDGGTGASTARAPRPLSAASLARSSVNPGHDTRGSKMINFSWYAASVPSERSAAATFSARLANVPEGAFVVVVVALAELPVPALVPLAEPAADPVTCAPHPARSIAAPVTSSARRVVGFVGPVVRNMGCLHRFVVGSDARCPRSVPAPPNRFPRWGRVPDRPR